MWDIRRFSIPAALAVVWAGSAACTPVEPPQRQPHVALFQPGISVGVGLAADLEQRGHCLFLIRDDGRRLGVAWPAGFARWDVVRNRIVVRESSAAPGERVEVGAEYVELEGGADARFVEKPQPECEGEDFVFVNGFVPLDAAP